MPSILYSVNGKLQSAYTASPEGQPHSTVYNKVDLTKPLMVAYKRISLKKDGDSSRKLMLSTYFKVQNTKQGAAEAVSYYSSSAHFPSGRFSLTDFGAKDYGHELCYYTNAYAGESLRLTVYPSELHKLDDDAVKALNSTVTRVAGLPMFAQFLPYVTLATQGVNIFEALVNFFLHDDVYSTIDCALYFNMPDSRILQSGRFVLVPDIDDDNVVNDAMLLDHYQLTADSQLVTIADGAEFAGSYYVIVIDALEEKGYEQFDYFQNAASLLELTNRGGDLGTIISQIGSLSAGYSDMDTVKRIEALRPSASDPDVQKQAVALFQTLSSDMKLVYQDRFNAAFSPHSAKSITLNLV